MQPPTIPQVNPGGAGHGTRDPFFIDPQNFFGGSNGFFQGGGKIDSFVTKFEAI